MKWMEAAWAEEGQAEVPGKDANPRIVAFFADVGLPGIKSDEVANCAAFVGACMVRSGLSLDAIPVDDRTLARSYLKVGTEIPEPRVGAIFVMKRGTSSWEGHTGFITAFDAKRVRVLGANQDNKVCEKWFNRDDRVLGYRWPEPPVKPKEIDSRIVTTAQQTKSDIFRAGGLETVDALKPKASEIGLDTLTSTANAAKGWAQTLESFVVFSYGKLGWVLGAIALFFLARAFWNSDTIQKLRAEDHNTGKNPGKVAA